jgi:hypothetical protein
VLWRRRCCSWLAALERCSAFGRLSIRGPHVLPELLRRGTKRGHAERQGRMGLG